MTHPSPAVAKWFRSKRSRTVLLAGLGGGALGYVLSWGFARALCAAGTCPIARDAVPLMCLLALAAAWGALSATQR